MKRLFRLGLVLAVPLVLVLAASGLRAEHDAATPSQKILEESIHDYLLNHPDVIIEALDILRAQRGVSEAEKTRQTLAAQRESIFDDPSSPIGGNPDGDVTIVEFFDYFCGYCKRVMPALIQAMDDDPGIRFIYKEFPILGPDSVTVARIALAAHRQAPDKYEGLHVALMGSRARLNEASALLIASEFGFDAERLKVDMNLDEIDRILAFNKALAKKLGIQGTPGFVIGDQVIRGAIDIETLRQLIAEARQS